MQLLRRLWLAKREESQAFLAAIAQPFLDRQAIALRLRNLLALLVEEHLIDQSLGLAPAERLGDLARLDAAVGQVLAIHLVIDAQCDPRSEERRLGKECVSTCRSWWSPYH